MSKSQSSFPLRWLLPAVQLMLCLIALWPWRITLAHQIGRSLGVYGISNPSRPEAAHPDGAVSVSAYMYADPQQLRTLRALESHEWVPLILNLPSGFVQLPYAAASPAKEDWRPRGLNLRTWRVISWPILGILFWWCAGRGIEALIAARRRLVNPPITWPETVMAVMLLLFCGFTAISLPLSGQPNRSFPVVLWMMGSSTWALLAGLTILARVMQWRLRVQVDGNAKYLVPDHA